MPLEVRGPAQLPGTSTWVNNSRGCPACRNNRAKRRNCHGCTCRFKRRRSPYGQHFSGQQPVLSWRFHYFRVSFPLFCLLSSDLLLVWWEKENGSVHSLEDDLNLKGDITSINFPCPGPRVVWFCYNALDPAINPLLKGVYGRSCSHIEFISLH